MSDTYRKIGEILAAARQAKGKSLAEASDATRIMSRYLEAVEAGDCSRLPSPPYFQLFVRSYAQFLGVDQAILEEIERSGREAETMAPEKAETVNRIQMVAVTKPKKAGSGRIALLLGAAVIVIAAGILLYTRWFPRPQGEAPKEDSPVGVATTSSRDSSAVDSPLVIPYSPYQGPDKLTLSLLPIRPVRVVLVQDGDTIVNRQVNTGEQLKWEARYRFQISLDAVDAAQLTLNGQAVLPLGPRGAAVADVEINQANFRQFLPPDPMTLLRKALADSLATISPPKAGGATGGDSGRGF